MGSSTPDSISSRAALAAHRPSASNVAAAIRAAANTAIPMSVISLTFSGRSTDGPWVDGVTWAPGTTAGERTWSALSHVRHYGTAEPEAGFEPAPSRLSE